MVAIILYGFLANVCYTGGWITEYFVAAVWGKERAKDFGQIAFALGLVGSVLLTTAPFVICALAVVVMEMRR